MKTIQTLALASMMLAVFVCSCSKKTETSTPSTRAIEGTWIGTQTEDGVSGSTYLSFTINSNNTLDFYTESGVISGSGTWLLSNNLFTATLTYRNDPGTQYTYTATYDELRGQLTAGTWGIQRGTNTGMGTWTLTKR